MAQFKTRKRDGQAFPVGGRASRDSGCPSYVPYTKDELRAIREKFAGSKTDEELTIAEKADRGIGREKNDTNNPAFKQLVVIQGLALKDKDKKVFEEDMKKKGFRIKITEVVKTLPDVEDGKNVKGTGGRTDVMFYIHDDDIGKFSTQRFGFSPAPRWWEDVVKYNEGSHLYSDKILKKYKTKW